MKFVNLWSASIKGTLELERMHTDSSFLRGGEGRGGGISVARAIPHRLDRKIENIARWVCMEM